MPHRKLDFLLPVILVLFACLPLRAQESRTAWFEDARFGMFIHWGLYSGAEGIWKGERHRHFNNYAEWIRYRNSIPREEYGRLASRFDWESIDPEQWVIMAKQAGMKYVTITAKHHDGVALWDTKVGSYSLPALSGSGRDVIAELAAACQKHGLKLGLYYSHWVDWDHPYGWSHKRELTKDLTQAQFDQYWQEKVVPQLRELLTGYGDIAMIWFDMWINHKETIVTEAELRQVLTLIRQLQPNAIVNSRLGLSGVGGPNDVDFESMGDNQLGAAYKDHPWQSPGTIAHSWGYHSLDNDWRSAKTLLQSLINNVSLNGNYMLNIGPRANGEVPAESVDRLRRMGEWLAVNGESIYGAGALDIDPYTHEWGKVTTKKLDDGKQLVYLHVYNWPLDKTLRVSAIAGRPSRIYLLADKQKQALSFTQAGPHTHIALPVLAPDPLVSVVVMEFDGEVKVEAGTVPESTYGGMSLKPADAAGKPFQQQLVRYNGTAPAHLSVKEKTTLTWRVYIDEPGERSVDLSYHLMSAKPKSSVIVTAGASSLTGELGFTGQTVVEPNENFIVDHFAEVRLGKLTFDKAGYHEIRLTIEPGKGEEVKLNWLWLSGDVGR